MEITQKEKPELITRDWNTVSVGELLQILDAAKGKIHSYNNLTKTLERQRRAIDEAIQFIQEKKKTMRIENLQLDLLPLLDTLIETLNFRPKIECPMELRKRLVLLQSSLGAFFCAGPRGDDDCGWNCPYVGTENVTINAVIPAPDRKAYPAARRQALSKTPARKKLPSKYAQKNNKKTTRRKTT